MQTPPHQMECDRSTRLSKRCRSIPPFITSPPNMPLHVNQKPRYRRPQERYIHTGANCRSLYRFLSFLIFGRKMTITTPIFCAPDPTRGININIDLCYNTVGNSHQTRRQTISRHNGRLYQSISQQLPNSPGLCYLTRSKPSPNPAGAIVRRISTSISRITQKRGRLPSL
jgi:hypothetical protein